MYSHRLLLLFQGSIALRGGEQAVEVKHSQGPLPRVLFEQTEGHIFWIQYRYMQHSLPAFPSPPPGCRLVLQLTSVILLLLFLIIIIIIIIIKGTTTRLHRQQRSARVPG
jgi:hypothetical protein